MLLLLILKESSMLKIRPEAVIAVIKLRPRVIYGILPNQHCKL